MSDNLSYVLVTPYTIAKSRTGGVLSRLLSRTDLELAGAQIFTPDADFADRYAASLRERAPQNQLVLLADYVKKYFAPSDGRPHRTLLLLFRGENPCGQLLNACGHLYTQHVGVDAIAGETIRDTYADLIFADDNLQEVRYFEPAVLTPRGQPEADNDLLMFANFLDGKENLVQNVNYANPSQIERTLVIIKPDNWAYHSSKPGTIVDMFSRTGLRIIGIKVHRFSLAEALDFYGPVETVLKEKLAAGYAAKAQELLEREFRVTLSQETIRVLNADFGAACAREQFFNIVEFMSGKRPGSRPGVAEQIDVKCMILVYEGENAVQKIRDVLGSTDPLKAREGTVRREFGSNIMVNTAHASDSPESYEREKNIVRINENPLVSIIRENVGQDAQAY
jgi:nucleoside diphosphate kinase